MSLPSRGAWIEIGSPGVGPGLVGSLPSRGAWIEMGPLLCLVRDGKQASLPSRGAWIEIYNNGEKYCIVVSLPSRGAWIEIARDPGPVRRRGRRSPHGERGLKFLIKEAVDAGVAGRSPHGERGLKSLVVDNAESVTRSLPSRGAWIEIGPM